MPVGVVLDAMAGPCGLVEGRRKAWEAWGKLETETVEMVMVWWVERELVADELAWEVEVGVMTVELAHAVEKGVAVAAGGQILVARGGV